MKVNVASGKATCLILRAIHVAHGMPKATRKKETIETLCRGRFILETSETLRLINAAHNPTS